MTGLPRTRLAALGGLLALGLAASPAVAHHKAGHDQPREEPSSGSGASSNGNPGTIKVAAPGEGTAPDNNPKPGCVLRVDFYGFNTGTYAVAINAHPPTGDRQLLRSDSVSITQPRKGADGHFQTSRSYDLRSALAGIEPAKQGYHVKVTVTNPSKPGNGGKHKVVWLRCPAAEESAAAPRGTSARPVAPAAAAAPVLPTVTRSSVTTPAEVLGVKVVRAAPAAVPAAPARVAALRDSLPFTGSLVGRLLWAALGFVALGLLVTAAARVAAPSTIR